MSNFDFKGVISALATPFNQGEVDYESYRKLLQFQFGAGIQGVVVNGTTGESPTLSAEEVEKMVVLAKQEAQGRVPVVVGTGSNNTKITIDFTRRASDWGGDAALVVVPYYNKPPQRGLLQHFLAVADASPIPVILYDVPGRTVVRFTVDTISELSRHPNIIGIKDATGDLERVDEIRKACSKEFVLSSGDDNSCMEFMAKGGDGVISVVSNIMPSQMVQWSNKVRSGAGLADDEARAFTALNDLVVFDTNPIPVKQALHFMDVFASPEMRLPLVAMEQDASKQLMDKMLSMGMV